MDHLENDRSLAQIKLAAVSYTPLTEMIRFLVFTVKAFTIVSFNESFIWSISCHYSDFACIASL